MKKFYILLTLTVLMYLSTILEFVSVDKTVKEVCANLLFVMYFLNIVSAFIFRKERLSYSQIAVFKITHILIELYFIGIFTLVGFGAALNPFLFLFAGFTAFFGFVIGIIFNIVILISTSIHSIGSLIKDKKSGKIRFIVLHVFLQFIFIVDIIDTIYLAKKEKDGFITKVQVNMN